ncbi:MAG: hypothetical protein DWQ01_12280 [Planctomycetota bacterium]|nr:MAG: hypothetical protein DWQ01_12280 [Planctomycetota bacterium]
MSSCPHSTQLIWSWIDREASELEPHLADCPSCRIKAEQIRGTIHQLSDRENASLPPVAPDAFPGFQLLRWIGEGASGTVYKARQKRPERWVAIKIFKAETRRRALIDKLFDRECWTLARLRHPDIAQIFVADRNSDGRPYLVMELVAGQPLLQAADAFQLDPKQRIQLFIRVCRAVEHAHQHGILHRDLKPDNILACPPPATSAGVISDWTVKVLDFGLADLIRIDDSWQNNHHGHASIGAAGTLPYMAPEQIAADEVPDIRADVYSLGVLLYELLVGDRPYALDSSSIRRSMEIISQHPPVAPSRKVPGMESDLEAILLKALSKQKELRYPSAGELAKDLERYLAHQPIQAVDPNYFYVLRKLIRRQPWVSALTFALIFAVCGLIGIQWKAERSLQTQLQRSQSAESHYRHMVGILAKVLASPDPFGQGITVRNMLDQAYESWQQADWSSKPRSATGLGFILARSFYNIGLYSKAETIADRSLFWHRQSGNLLQGTSRREILHLLGRIKFKQGRYHRAIDFYRRTLEAFQKDGIPPEMSCKVRFDLAQALQEFGRMKEAEEQFLIGLKTPNDRENGPDLAEIRGRSMYASLLATQGHWKAADQILQENLLNQSRYFPEADLDAADILHQRARLWMLSHRPGLAQQLALQAEVHLKKKLGPTHPHLAPVLDTLSRSYSIRGEWEKARRCLQQSVDLRNYYFGHDHPETARAYLHLGLFYFQRDSFPEAEEAFHTALTIAESQFPDPHPEFSDLLLSKARLDRELGRLAEAEAGMGRALAMRHALHDPDHPDIAACQEALASLRVIQGRWPEALELLQGSHAIYTRRLVLEHPRVALNRQKTARVLWQLDRKQEALDTLETALDLRDGSPAASSLRNLDALLTWCEWSISLETWNPTALENRLQQAETILSLGASAALQKSSGRLEKLKQDVRAHFEKPETRAVPHE